MSQFLQQRLYLAGPDIFLPEAAAIAAQKKALCRHYGFIGLHPLDAEQPMLPTPGATAMAIYRSNTALMAAADAVVANLTPFRGPSADAGTVFELGWMLGRGKPAFGYSLAADLFRERSVAARPGARFDAASGRWFDADGMEIEDFGLRDNLMIDCALQDGGYPLFTAVAGAAALAGFEACLRAARAHFDRPG
jgi:nucleoside 2-deoxyribosyltransferase